MEDMNFSETWNNYLDSQAISDYKRLCQMSFQQVQDLTEKVKQEQNDNHFDYAGALDAICNKIDAFKVNEYGNM